MELFFYTYKLRGMGPGCQPKNIHKWTNVEGCKYEVICYTRKLTKEEIEEFELIEW